MDSDSRSFSQPLIARMVLIVDCDRGACIHGLSEIRLIDDRRMGKVEQRDLPGGQDMEECRQLGMVVK